MINKLREISLKETGDRLKTSWHGVFMTYYEKVVRDLMHQRNHYKKMNKRDYIKDYFNMNGGYAIVIGKLGGLTFFLNAMRSAQCSPSDISKWKKKLKEAGF